MSVRTAAALAVGASLVLGSSAMAQQFNDKPLEENWWPTEWGPDDKVGAPNRTTPELVLEAVGLVKQGKTATLGKLYASDIPFFGARGFRLNIPGTPTGGPFGSNGLVFHDELVTTELGQVGTQFDGPGHIGVRTSQGDLFYNGRNREDTYQRGPGNMVIGMGDLGVESVAEKGFVCRGVLLDGPKYPGRQSAADPDHHRQPRHHHRRRRQSDGRGPGNRRDRRGRLRVPLHRPRRSVEEQRVAVALGRGEGGAGRDLHLRRARLRASAPARTSPSRRSS